MIDPKDIDALLIGALYGELTPADEARLAAHLDSHPTDRSALDGLRFTRDAVRESRILAVQLDPPQAISALLLQEAHRRAPKAVPIRERANTDEGWFARFVRSFAAHPAMAAAAMLVLVLGIGGIMYKRHGADQFAESAAPSLAVSTPSAGSAMAAAPGTTEPALALALEGARDGQQAYGSGGQASVAPVTTAKGGKLDQGESVAVTLDDSKDGKASSEKLAKQQQGIEVRTGPTPEPKEFAFNDAKPTPKAPPKVAAPTTGSKNSPKDGIARSEDESIIGSMTGDVTNAVSGAGATVDGRVEEQKKEATKAKEDDSWAKDQHARVTSLAKAGNCPDAAKLAAAIASRTPEYYATHIATDRTLKTCSAYITEAREKDAERANKARAQKRLDANEPSPAPSK